MSTTVYYFSPTGGTRKAALGFAKGIAGDVRKYDMLRHEGEHASYGQGDVVVFAAPVFAGRIPECVTQYIRTTAGNGASAAVLAVYGNRDFDDALLELTDTVKSCGYSVIAAAAAIAQHSLSPAVGAGRPDAKDLDELMRFGRDVASLAESGSVVEPAVPGNFPYKDTQATPFASYADDKCISCGQCAEICPVQVISSGDFTVAEPEKCILCKACVSVCPVGARKLPGEFLEKIQKRLQPLESVRKKNEFFPGQ